MQISILDKAFFLKQTAFFGSLDLDLLLILAEKAELITYKKDEVVFPMHSETHRMYLIVDGKVRIERQEEHTTIKKGDCFGDEALFSQRPHGYLANCQKDTLLLVLMRSHILSLIEQSPGFACELLRLYTKSTSLRLRT